MAQAVECQLCKHEGLHSKPSPTKKKKKEKKKNMYLKVLELHYF
jgi:hypothetical protein